MPLNEGDQGDYQAEGHGHKPFMEPLGSRHHQWKGFASAGEMYVLRSAGFSASPHRKRPKHTEVEDARRANRHHSRKAPLPPLRDYPEAYTNDTRPGFTVKSPGHVPLRPGKTPARTEQHKRARQPHHSLPGSGRRPRSYVYVWNDL